MIDAAADRVVAQGSAPGTRPVTEPGSIPAAAQNRKPRALQVLTRQPQGYLISANALTALGSGVQQLIQGWLAVSWGGSPLFLIAFAAARLLPKVALTLPAGVICDRVSRVRLLTACRTLNVGASVLPLLGFVFGHGLFLLMIAIALGGAIHAFDLPSGRALLGDVPSDEDLPSVIALNNGGSHLAALIGPPIAFLMGPYGLLVSSVLFGLAALLTALIHAPEPQCHASSAPAAVTSGVSSGLHELLEFARGAPAVTLLLALGLAPGIVDKLVLLLLPSISHGTGATSLALLAPEAGALLAATLLATRPVRISLAGILCLAAAYSALLAIAMSLSFMPELLIAGLALAGVAKLAFNTTSQTRIQQAVPGGLRGRVLTF
ncbi:MAG TPA: MFS transporter [Dehalococcoidia bacterium]|nr:MFS transporter [Dehalococcoidia bacterium]